jgi:hypothetical protein
MVTWHALVCALSIIAGIISAVYGFLRADAEGMSDAPTDGKAGAAPLLIGLALIVGGIVGALL